ncbi:hypothetical protein BP5796_02828 [Coleophoma crateriformis]|uniref:Uncharacterized protein n=1 Tax=Coleophoma crateriformis TaxID=565419 RepID=A0A3D8SZA9_9HELO|nr:hypothetical protein BP5796_02828 [Coleophoma crateriformis]
MRIQSDFSQPPAKETDESAEGADPKQGQTESDWGANWGADAGVESEDQNASEDRAASEDQNASKDQNASEDQNASG